MTSQRQQLPINLNPVFEALERPLDLMDDPERRAQFERFIANGRVYQEKALVELVSSLVAGLNGADPALRASIEVQADGYVLNLDRDSQAADPVFDADDEIERVTLRLPRQLKTLIDQQAERSGHSTNSWYIRTLARALAHQMRGSAAGQGGAPGAYGPGSAPFGPNVSPWGRRGRGRRRDGGEVTAD